MNYQPDWTAALLWVVIVAFLVAFVLGFAMGANDCANSYGPTVGSGVLKLWHAYLLATVFEIAGAALLGYKVTNTLRRSIVNLDIFDVYVRLNESDGKYYPVASCTGSPSLITTIGPKLGPNPYQSGECKTYTEAAFMIGAFGALVGCAVWLLIATFFKVPVSTTHSTIGATVGFSLTIKGAMGINWMMILEIVLSWVISPVLAGVVSTLFYAFIKLFAMNQDDPLESSLKLLPWLFLFTIVVNLFSVIYDGSKYLYFDRLPWWGVLFISLTFGITTALVVRFVAINRIRRYAKGAENQSQDISTDPGMTANKVVPRHGQSRFDATARDDSGNGSGTVEREMSEIASVDEACDGPCRSNQNGDPNDVTFTTKLKRQDSNNYRSHREPKPSDRSNSEWSLCDLTTSQLSDNVFESSHDLKGAVPRSNLYDTSTSPSQVSSVIRSYTWYSMDANRDRRDWSPTFLDGAQRNGLDKHELLRTQQWRHLPEGSRSASDGFAPPLGIYRCSSYLMLVDQIESGGIDRRRHVDVFEMELLPRVAYQQPPQGWFSKLIKPSEEPYAASNVFGSLQILSSVFLSFSHGSNDTANAVGPLVALWVTFKSGYALTESEAFDAAIEGLIIYGAAAMIIGLWCLGHKVIQTVGKEITSITPATGFCMQLGTAFTVLFCSKIGIPVSTTHCLIGAVVAVGWFRTRQGVSWRMFGNIAFAWIVTLPVTMGISALVTWLLLFTL